MVSCCFFNDTATTEIYTLSLHDALPILAQGVLVKNGHAQTLGLLVLAAWITPHHDVIGLARDAGGYAPARDRKSTRLNSSHANISYAVFCLKKKQIQNHVPTVSQLRVTS